MSVRPGRAAGAAVGDASAGSWDTGAAAPGPTTSTTGVAAMVTGDSALRPWDRRPKEPTHAFGAFERFLRLGPLRDVGDVGGSPRVRALLSTWFDEYDWSERAEAFDADCHRQQERARLELLRDMHSHHSTIGREVVDIAYERLRSIPPEALPVDVAVRLLQLGARLERDTLTVSVEELQGVDPTGVVDPWEAVARELDNVPAD